MEKYGHGKKGEKRKIRQAVVYTTFTKRKTKLKKQQKKLTHKYIQMYDGNQIVIYLRVR